MPLITHVDLINGQPQATAFGWRRGSIRLRMAVKPEKTELKSPTLANQGSRHTSKVAD